jgi:hypothetical protein
LELSLFDAKIWLTTTVYFSFLCVYFGSTVYIFSEIVENCNLHMLIFMQEVLIMFSIILPENGNPFTSSTKGEVMQDLLLTVWLKKKNVILQLSTFPDFLFVDRLACDMYDTAFMLLFLKAWVHLVDYFLLCFAFCIWNTSDDTVNKTEIPEF